MAYYLDTTSNHKGITLSDPIYILQSVGDYIELDIVPRAGGDQLASNPVFFDFALFFTGASPTSLSVCLGGSRRNFTNASVLDLRVKIKLERTGDSLVTISCNEVGFSATFTNSNFVNSFVSRLLSASDGRFVGKTDFYSFTVFSSGVIANYYDPSATGGTGSVLEDTVGGNNGTLVNFPVDNSQWVFYDAGGGGLVITSVAIASAESFGTPAFTTGAVTLSPTAIATAEALGNPTLSQGATFINPLAINTEEFIGVPVVTPQGVIITPTAIPTGASVGNPDVSVGLTLVFPEQIFTEEFVGEPQLEMLLKQIFPTGIITAQLVGRPLVLGGDSIVIPIESRVTWNAVAKYLRELVFKGADNDVIMAWMRSEGFEEAYNDNWEDYLLSEGYLTGSQADRYAAWRRGEVGIADPWILTSGSWDDSRIWVDTATWKDN